MIPAPCPHPLAEIIASLGLPPTDGPVARQRPNFPPPKPTEDDMAKRREELLEYLPAAFRHLSLKGAELAQYVAGGQRTVNLARRAFAEAAKRTPAAPLGHVVLRGTSGSGKTAIATAWAADCIRAGRDVLFVPMVDIDCLRSMSNGGTCPWEDLARTARLVVLDDLGAELKGAEPKSFTAAERRGPTNKVLQGRCHRGLRHVVTTAHNVDSIALNYDDGIARRVYSGAVTVELPEQ